MITGIGGGYGSPWLREPELVLNDIRDGLVTPELARRAYGVVIHPGRLVVDTAATAELRRGLQAVHSYD